jgi:hypothetical protein
MVDRDKTAEQIPDEDRHVIQVVFDHFHRTGDWPLLGDLRHQLDLADDDFDLPAVRERLDPGLGLIPLNDDAQATLYIHGVAICSGSDQEMGDILAVMQYAYRKFRAEGPKAKLTHPDMFNDLGMDLLRLRRTTELLRWLPGIGGGSGDPADDSWYRDITSDIVRVKKVKAQDDLLAIAYRPQRPAPRAADGWTTATGAGGQVDRIKRLGDPVTQEMQRITENIDKDPAAAITASRALVETVCKILLEELGEPLSDTEKLPAMYKRLARALRLDPGAPDAKCVPLLQGLVTTVEGVGQVRNSLSTAHGRTSARPAALPRHARVAAGAAATVCAFLIETADERKAGLD